MVCFVFTSVVTSCPLSRVEDHMGKGDSQPAGKDNAFWSALTARIPNLHVVISGHGKFNFHGMGHVLTEITPEHGNEWCARERKDKVVFCFAKHSG
jgi:hypothetical protein